MKKIFSIISTTFTAILVIIAMLLVGVRIFGYTPYAIIGSSMEPAFSVGSIVYVKPTPLNEIEEGMPITYILNEDLVVSTHRVVEVDQKTQLVTTKGDANNTVDGKPVHYKNILGVVKYSLPYLGYLSVFIASRKGFLLTIAFISLILISSLLGILFDGRKKTEK